MENEGVEELERAIAELKAKWAAHSIPPKMWLELEELENKLEQARAEQKAGKPKC